MILGVEEVATYLEYAIVAWKNQISQLIVESNSSIG